MSCQDDEFSENDIGDEEFFLDDLTMSFMIKHHKSCILWLLQLLPQESIEYSEISMRVKDMSRWRIGALEMLREKISILGAESMSHLEREAARRTPKSITFRAGF